MTAEGVELSAQVYLVHNGLNKHDSNATEVHGSTGLLGHLSREDAARYVSIVEVLQRRGLIATTNARIWGRNKEDWDTGKQVFVGSVRIDLPEPHMMVPRNQPPAQPHQLLPRGSAVRVTALQDAANATNSYLCNEGECWVYATLHQIVDQGPRSSKQLAEVRIDGQPVGRLTPKMSSDMLPAVQFLTAHGLLTGVRAVVKGNRLKCDVVVYAARASELSQDWVNALPDTASTAALMPEESVADISGIPDQSAAPNELPPPQGWYPDPQGAARLRWWDGTGWTQHTAP